jgi:hypothetical protein
LPNVPVEIQVAVPIVPVLPLPEASAALGPRPSLNEYAAARPALGAALVRDPPPMTNSASSAAKTRRACLPIGRSPSRRRYTVALPREKQSFSS